MSSFIPAELIRKKRFGGENSKEEILFLIQNYLKGEVSEAQIASWLMAICLKGMTDQETAFLTQVMMQSGVSLDFSKLQNISVDKHSTGGVGDKTSLIIAPLVAAAGLPVPMMAGRGLGHTGGTLDKLESIEGFNVRLDLERFKSQVSTIGAAIIGQTKDICPADLKLYSLRDVTGTVDSIPLICASIMSKKLAEGVQGLVLDVKYGSGAFMRTSEEAEKLARGLVQIGHLSGRKIRALITSMNQPLGRYAGNACEVEECLTILKNEDLNSPHKHLYFETRELSLILSAHMLQLGGKASTIEQGYDMCNTLINNGAALQKFYDICLSQDAQPNWTLPKPKNSELILAESSGFVESMNVEEIGLSGIQLKAGRKSISDTIDYSSGIEFFKKIGDPVQKGDPLFRVFGMNSNLFAGARQRLSTALKLSPVQTKTEKLIFKIVEP